VERSGLDKGESYNMGGKRVEGGAEVGEASTPRGDGRHVGGGSSRLETEQS
jgi:hypothetical protein